MSRIRIENLLIRDGLINGTLIFEPAYFEAYIKPKLEIEKKEGQLISFQGVEDWVN